MPGALLKIIQKIEKYRSNNFHGESHSNYHNIESSWQIESVYICKISLSEKLVYVVNLVLYDNPMKSTSKMSIKILLEANSDPNLRKNDSYTALIYASQDKSLSFVNNKK